MGKTVVINVKFLSDFACQNAQKLLKSVIFYGAIQKIKLAFYLEHSVEACTHIKNSKCNM